MSSEDQQTENENAEQVLKFSHEGPKHVCEGSTKLLLGFHGKSRRMCTCEWSELIESNMQLNQPGKTADEGFVIPTEGIDRTLSGLFVLLSPKN